MNVFKWTNPRFYMCFSPDEGGTPAPASGGGDGGSSVPASPSAGDGGGSAPAAAPASTPEPAPSATPEPSPWAQLGSNEDLDHPEIPEIAPVVPPVAPVAPAATPPASAQPPVDPSAQPGAPTPPAPDAQPSAAPLSPSDPVGIAAAIEQNRDAVIAHLAQTKFALSEADVQELEADVTTAVPKLLGRVFMESQVAMQKFLAQAVPGMIKNFQTVTSANEGAEKQFFEAHKQAGLDMNNPQHRATTSRIASLYRQANPGIKLDQLIADVGPMVVASLARSGVQLQAPAASPNPGAPAPMLPRGGTPFRPAVNGGGGAPPVPAADPNPWSGLGQEFE